MNKIRVNNIKEKLKDLAPEPGKEYTTQEQVDIYVGLEKGMAEGVYEKTHAEYMSEKEVLKHISSLAEEHGLKASVTFKRFEANMNDLSYTIGSFIKGMKGERIARRDLKLLSYDKGVKIFYNIALEDEDAQAEYDAIVISPYGIFVVEVKNWGSEMSIDEQGILRREDQNIRYDLPGRMGIKEGLLRGCLEELFPNKYQGILLFSNENAKVDDLYQQIPICFGGGISYAIRRYNNGEEILKSEQIEEIAAQIQNMHKVQKAPCKVNCEELIDDYAVLMAAIEEAAEGRMNSVEELINIELENSSREVKAQKQDMVSTSGGVSREEQQKEQSIPSWLVGAIGGAVLTYAGFAASKWFAARK